MDIRRQIENDYQDDMKEIEEEHLDWMKGIEDSYQNNMKDQEDNYLYWRKPGNCEHPDCPKRVEGDQRTEEEHLAEFMTKVEHSLDIDKARRIQNANEFKAERIEEAESRKRRRNASKRLIGVPPLAHPTIIPPPPEPPTQVKPTAVPAIERLIVEKTSPLADKLQDHPTIMATSTHEQDELPIPEPGCTTVPLEETTVTAEEDYIPPTKTVKTQQHEMEATTPLPVHPKIVQPPARLEIQQLQIGLPTQGESTNTNTVNKDRHMEDLWQRAIEGARKMDDYYNQRPKEERQRYRQRIEEMSQLIREMEQKLGSQKPKEADEELPHYNRANQAAEELTIQPNEPENTPEKQILKIEIKTQPPKPTATIPTDDPVVTHNHKKEGTETTHYDTTNLTTEKEMETQDPATEVEEEHPHYNMSNQTTKETKLKPNELPRKNMMNKLTTERHILPKTYKVTKSRPQRPPTQLTTKMQRYLETEAYKKEGLLTTSNYDYTQLVNHAAERKFGNNVHQKEQKSNTVRGTTLQMQQTGISSTEDNMVLPRNEKENQHSQTARSVTIYNQTRTGDEDNEPQTSRHAHGENYEVAEHQQPTTGPRGPDERRYPQGGGQ